MARMCSRCICDETVPMMTFDAQGICNYCRQHEMLDREYPTGEAGRDILETLAGQIRKDGRGKKYDCVVGVSGGCDSSFMLQKTCELGLRPLAVHYDNTWDSNTAVQNIRKLIKKLGLELYTHVVNNEEQDDIYRSFLLASVPDIDTPADIALTTTLYLAAEKVGVKYIFNGHSFRTEGIAPPGWFYMDGRYIDSIQKQFGTRKIETFPNLLMSRWLKWLVVDRVKRIRPLYYVEYNKEEVKRFLHDEFGWQWYGGHHMENRWALFTDNYYMPKKFGIDLRIVEFSSMIRSGQMTKEEALEEIAQPPPIDQETLDLVKKRLSLSDEDFERIMAAPKKTYRDFETYKKTFERMRPFFWLMYKMDLVPKSFYMKYTR